MEDSNTLNLKDQNFRSGIQSTQNVQKIIENSAILGITEVRIQEDGESFWSPSIPKISEVIVEVGFLRLKCGA